MLHASGKSVLRVYDIPSLHTPAYVVLHTSSIHFWHCPWPTIRSFSHFKRPIDKASMTLLHYVASRPSAHPFQMARRRHDVANVNIFFKIQKKVLKNMLSNCHCWLKNTSSHCWNSILITISLLVWILDTALYRAVISLDLTFSLFGCLPFHTIRNPPASDGHVPVRLQQPNSSYCRNFQVSICLAVEWTGMLRNMYTNWG